MSTKSPPTWPPKDTVIALNKHALNIIRPGRIYSISSSSPAWDDVLQALHAKDLDEMIRLIQPIARVADALQSATAVNSDLSVEIDLNADRVVVDGYPVEGALAERVLYIHRNNLDYQPFVNFIRRLRNNPSKTAVQELFLFLEHAKTPIPVLENGCFLAYKKVRNNWMDIHSGTMDNSPGKTVSIPRNQVDDDRRRTCSTGLHFCSLSYLSHFGSSSNGTDRVVALEIDPADVVSIPIDYNNAKGRACKYKVLYEIEDWQNHRWAAPVMTRASAVPAPSPKASQNLHSSTGSDDPIQFHLFKTRQAARQFVARNPGFRLGDLSPGYVDDKLYRYNVPQDVENFVDAKTPTSTRRWVAWIRNTPLVTVSTPVDSATSPALVHKETFELRHFAARKHLRAFVNAHPSYRPIDRNVSLAGYPLNLRQMISQCPTSCRWIAWRKVSDSLSVADKLVPTSSTLAFRPVSVRPCRTREKAKEFIRNNPGYRLIDLNLPTVGLPKEVMAVIQAVKKTEPHARWFVWKWDDTTSAPPASTKSVVSSQASNPRFVDWNS